MTRILSNTLFLVILMICCANLFEIHNAAANFKMKVRKSRNKQEIEVTPEDTQELERIAENNIDISESEEYSEDDTNENKKEYIDVQNEMRIIQAFVDKKPGFRASCGKKKLNKIKKNIEKMRKNNSAHVNKRII